MSLDATVIRYAISIIAPPGYIHSRAFTEIALGLYYAMRELGQDVVIATDLSLADRQYIIFGSNLIPFCEGIAIPQNAILYNLEQISPDDSLWVNGPFLSLLQSHPIWDYSQRNIDNLNQLGITNIRHVPIGYVPELTRIQPAPKKDIDVLFFGSLTPSREVILNGLKERGVNLHVISGLYGEERDSFIARSKIILNLHAYKAQVFEIVRVSYLLANRCFVISENITELEEREYFAPGVVFADYENIVAACQLFLTQPATMNFVAEQGFQLMRARRQTDALAFLKMGQV